MWYLTLCQTRLFNAWKGECRPCHAFVMEHAIKPLVQTYFNVTADNFTMLLNRRELSKNLTMKMVKDLKNKQRHVNSLVSKNDDRDVSSWTCKFSRGFLQGNQAESRDRFLSSN